MRSVILLLLLSCPVFAEELRRPLDVWCVGRCANESAFWHDYQTDAAFRGLVDQHYIVRHLIISRYPVQALARGIFVGPTFESVGRPRVIGYRGSAALLNELGIRTSTVLPSMSHTAPASEPERIDQAELTRAFQQAVDEAISRTRQELASDQDARSREQQQQLVNQLFTINDRLQRSEQQTLETLSDFARRLQDVVTPASDAPSWHTPPDATPESTAPAAPSLLSRLLRFGSTWGPLAGVLASGGGGLAIAWAVLGSIAKRRGSQSRPSTINHPASTRCNNCKRLEGDKRTLANEIADLRQQLNDAEHDPLNKRFVPYETDSFKAAFDEAVNAMMIDSPGARDVLTCLHDRMKRILASKGVKK